MALEHAALVLGGGALLGALAVGAVQKFSKSEWVRWWDFEDIGLDKHEDGPAKEAPADSAHATLMKRKAPRQELASQEDHAKAAAKHQYDIMTQEQRERSDELSRLLLGTDNQAEVAEKLAALRAKAEEQAKRGQSAEGMRLKHILDIAVYVTAFAVILYLLSVEYNVDLGRATRSFLPEETEVLERMGARLAILRASLRQLFQRLGMAGADPS